MHDTRPPQLSLSPLLKPLHPAEKLPQRKPASDREKRKMGSRAALFVLVIVLCYGLAMAVSSVGDEDWRREKEGREDWRREREETEEEETEDWFLLQDSKKVVTTDAGEMRVVRSLGGRIVDRPMHIGFIAMEPKTLFIPQYLDSSLILFIRRGEAKIGFIYKDALAERRLKTGDVYRLPAGSAFYLVNTGEGQRLHIICSIDTSEGLGLGTFQSFFIGGGSYPTSVLAGFDRETLSHAFNVSFSEVREILTRQREGPIVYVPDARSPSVWAKFLQMKDQDRLQHLKRMVLDFQEEPDHDHQEEQTWSWRKLLNSMLGKETKRRGDKGTGKSPDSYNLYDRRPDFSNNYGWSLALDESDYDPLKRSGIGVYLVNLTAGSMMAPHVNPTATEYGIVLSGSGTIQVVFPNGTSAMNAKITEGDVFWVPRYFPFCQIASRTGPLEFFGFTTSARKNRPQFLVGASSVLRTMLGPELAAAFGVDEERLRDVVEAQQEAVILPSTWAAPPDKKTKKFARAPRVIKSFGNDMIMGFD
ncbi:vicilin-like seed storage protein At2g28490 [Alnus glutinosa]|uniref:vicilin-like seed storage protein At2g28490 n=1 Tax=Alnus glutinosa TaxID=3517 RepID=UPI002D7780E0|nr:vicilin-like seed storage protein At2g28490 [Alnus glutinosa]